MDSQDSFLEFHIEKLIAGVPIPIDLPELTRRIGAVLQEREMIPEAAMQVKGGQFHIYLQSNFQDRPGAALRQRFSFAHEIAHTLFFELRDGALKARKDAPIGDRLEAACHKGAAMLLVPNKVLTNEISQKESVDTGTITELAERFEVSIEVMLRRLNDVGAFESGLAPVLTRRSAGKFEIEFAVYPPWLKSHLLSPKRGADFTAWFRPTEQSEGSLIKKRPDGTLKAQPFEVTASLRIFEVRFQPH